MIRVTNELLNKSVVIGNRLLRKRSARALWFILVLGIAISQAMMFLRLHQNIQILHSTYEMVLVGALWVVMLLGISVKSRPNLRK